MILVIVFVHAVTPDEVQIRIMAFELLANCGDVARIIVVVNWICFLLANNATVHKITLFGQTDLNQFAFRQLDQIAIARIPKTVVFKAEIFEAIADLIGIGYHLWRPRAEVLNAANLNAWVVNIDPIVIEHMSISQNEHDREKVTVLEAFRRVFRPFTYRWRQSADQFSHRCR